MTDRIKLAEAMGWVSDDTKTVHDLGDGYPTQRTSFHWSHPDHERKRFAHELPDPENDANDDNAVLVWTRTQGTVFQVNFAAKLREHPADYMIGNNYRAALKVIEESK